MNEIIKRLYYYFAPWERDCTYEEFAEDVKNDPFSAIEFLLNEIEEILADEVEEAGK